MELMIPGSIELEGDLSARFGGWQRKRLAEQLKRELWRRCEQSGGLTDLPSYRAVFRRRELAILCEAEFHINGDRSLVLGSGGHPGEALFAALRGATEQTVDFRPAAWGVSPLFLMPREPLRRALP